MWKTSLFYRTIFSDPGKIQSLKHSVPKGDKKKKKEITLEIAKLEAELEERHKKEINEYNNDNKVELYKYIVHFEVLMHEDNNLGSILSFCD